MKAITNNKKQLDSKQLGTNELLLSKERDIFKTFTAKYSIKYS